jgi:hypothetical protein
LTTKNEQIKLLKQKKLDEEEAKDERARSFINNEIKKYYESPKAQKILKLNRLKLNAICQVEKIRRQYEEQQNVSIQENMEEFRIRMETNLAEREKFAEEETARLMFEKLKIEKINKLEERRQQVKRKQEEKICEQKEIRMIQARKQERLIRAEKIKEERRSISQRQTHKKNEIEIKEARRKQEEKQEEEKERAQYLAREEERRRFSENIAAENQERQEYEKKTKAYIKEQQRIREEGPMTRISDGLSVSGNFIQPTEDLASTIVSSGINLLQSIISPVKEEQQQKQSVLQPKKISSNVKTPSQINKS